MKIYVKAKSKKAVNESLENGEDIYGENMSFLSFFGGAGMYKLDENLEKGTVIAIYSQMSGGSPVAKSWGTWTGSKLK